MVYVLRAYLTLDRQGQKEIMVVLEEEEKRTTITYGEFGMEGNIFLKISEFFYLLSSV